jgi:F0F1-type ATP synthase membrane subunit b/b'
VAGILDRARQQIDADLKSAMADLDVQVTQTRAELSQRATSLADEAVTRVLGA